MIKCFSKSKCVVSASNGRLRSKMAVYDGLGVGKSMNDLLEHTT
jgi:hypothetical protein